MVREASLEVVAVAVGGRRGQNEKGEERERERNCGGVPEGEVDEVDGQGELGHERFHLRVSDADVKVASE